LAVGQVSDTRASGRVELPINEAFRISLEQIQRRMRRSSITIASVALSIAFMAYFLVTNLIFESYGSRTGIKVETYQFWLIVVSFLVSIISLTNSTLIAVYERVKEIGTMKFLGALDRHVLELFLIEATIYGLIGGILGFIGGVFGATFSTSLQIGLGAILGVPVLGFITHLGLSIGLAVVLSLAATIYPAYKAAKLKPVEALAYEI